MAIQGQNSMVGDGFGGRLWYNPYNFTSGSYSAYTLCSDSGQLYAWGDNEYGQLGDGTTASSAIPVKVKGMSNVKYYSTGYVMGVIKKDNTAWVWGWGTPYHLNPIQVLTDVKFIDAGSENCTFIKNDGTVWSTGVNRFGQFGTGIFSVKDTIVPQKMIGIDSAVRVANSAFSNTILLKNGTLMATGTNARGIIGNNASQGTKWFTPVAINGIKDIVDIKANSTTVIALDKNGFVYAWGTGGDGGIGNGKTDDTYTPLKIPTLKNIVAISGCNDGDHFMAIDSAHNCYGWGDNYYGQLGDSTKTSILTPIFISANVDDIMAGENHSYIIKNGNELWASGQSKTGSIWLNLPNIIRKKFVQLEPAKGPSYLCEPTSQFPIPYKSYYVTLCEGDSFMMGKHSYKTTGTYLDTFKNWENKDSIVTTNIHLNPKSSFKQTVTICSSEQYKISKNTYTVSGNYIDTIDNYQGCDSVISTQLIVKPISNKIQTIDICEGDYFMVDQSIYNKSGLYLDSFINYHGCDSVVYTTLRVNKKPFANFKTTSLTLKSDDTISFLNLSVGANQYRWLFGKTDSTFIQNPQKLFLNAGFKEVQLIAIDNTTGCKDTALQMIQIIDNANIYIPNVFYPNGDNLNDFFFPVSRNYDKITMRIFNRWGELLYETHEFTQGWDGTYQNKACEQDVYMYILQLQNSSNNNSKSYSGTLTLLR